MANLLIRRTEPTQTSEGRFLRRKTFIGNLVATLVTTGRRTCNTGKIGSFANKANSVTSSRGRSVCRFPFSSLCSCCAAAINYSSTPQENDNGDQRRIHS